MEYRTLADLPKDAKRIFLRVDFNVPLKEGKITDDTRIRAALPTIHALLDKGCALVLASHLGRPKTEEDKTTYSLAPIAKHLSALLGNIVQMAPSPSGEKTAAMAHALQPGEILLLENVRFHPGETKDDVELAKEWASYADAYVNDAFGTCHRAHASVSAITQFLPSITWPRRWKALPVPLSPSLVVRNSPQSLASSGTSCQRWTTSSSEEP